ncbi:MAG: hypothetical protein LBM98_11715 [Oscillospiraceae bacterium]|nr:hypothetical protein [Oscillospiraceae bacterium]
MLRTCNALRIASVSVLRNDGLLSFLHLFIARVLSCVFISRSIPLFKFTLRRIGAGFKPAFFL